MKIAAQIIGIIGLVIVVISLQQKTREKVLLLQIFSNICYGTQMYLCGSKASAVLFLVYIMRNIVFFYKDKLPLRKKNWIPLFFISLMLINTIFNYENIFTILLFIASVFFTFGLWFDNMKAFRKIALVDEALWIVNDLYIGAYVAAISALCETVSTCIAIYRYDIKKEKEVV